MTASNESVLIAAALLLAPLTGSARQEPTADLLEHALMHFTQDQQQRQLFEHFLAPQWEAPPVTGISKFDLGLPASMDLFYYWPYTPATMVERDQGYYCGNCWQWSGTGVMEIALAAQTGVRDRLSVQFINSCAFHVVSGATCCGGGVLSDFAAFYSGQGFAIPWSNTNAQFTEGWDSNCISTPCRSIAVLPQYRVGAMQVVSVRTHGVGKDQAIANIKSRLNQNKAVTFSFRSADKKDWNNFAQFWYYAPESSNWAGFPCRKYGTTASAGGHDVLCIGYNDVDPTNRYWIMVNSWGNALGQRPNGIFRVSMDLSYDCTYTNGGYTYFWKSLDIQFDTLPGTYAGLFAPEDGASPASSGYFTARITSKHSLSGKLQLGGKQYSFTGKFPETGSYSTLVPRAGLAPLTIVLDPSQLEVDVLSGTISDGAWTARLVAHRATYSKLHPAPLAGKYTVALPGSEDSSRLPGGSGFGAVTVDASGNVSFSGTLADGTKVSQRTFVSQLGQWPLFCSLSSGKGMLIGWLNVSSGLSNNVIGSVSWTKPGQPGGKPYSGGFAFETEVVGSAYILTRNLPLLQFANGQMEFSGLDSNQNFTNQIFLNVYNRVTNMSSNKLALSFTTASGLFKGTAANPMTGETVRFEGAVLQNQNCGVGYFLSRALSGQVCLAPADHPF